MANGQSIFIKGDISGSEDLVIAGRVEGTIDLDGRVLTLAPGSRVQGSVSAGSVIVSGEIDGSILAANRLEIRETAVVSGDVNTPVLVVAEGAQVCAEIEMPQSKKAPVAVAV